jgi:hypothetical protein
MYVQFCRMKHASTIATMNNSYGSSVCSMGGVLCRTCSKVESFYFCENLEFVCSFVRLAAYISYNIAPISSIPVSIDLCKFREYSDVSDLERIALFY